MASRRSSESSEQDLLFGNGLRAQQATKKWDVFRDPPTKSKSRSMAETVWLDRAEAFAKLLAYIVTFGVVLGCAVISKGTLLFIVSQISNDTKIYCNQNLGINQEFRVTLPQVERVSWIWILIFIYWVPEIGTFIRSARVCLFKTYGSPTIFEFVSVFFTETLPAIGSALLVFCVLPEFDVVKGAMLTNAVCLIPGLIGFASRDHRRIKKSFKSILDIISCVAQVSALVVWPIIENKASTWLTPVSLLLISFGWWENFLSESSPIRLLHLMGKAKRTFENKKYFIYIFASLWKCLVFFVTTLIIFWIKEGDIQYLFDDFSAAFQSHMITITEVVPIAAADDPSMVMVSGSTLIPTDYWTIIWVFLINIASTYTCYAFGKFACKIRIQGFSYAFPTNLAVPLTISLLIAMCGLFNEDPCYFHNTIPSYLFFKSPPLYLLSNYISHGQTWLWLFWLLSQTWITIHIWNPTSEKLAKTEKLFFRPMYDAFLIDQDLALNRRRGQQPEHKESEKQMDNDDTITNIYVCGTMWHETKEEMMEFLKSVMRLDRDQCARRIVRDFMKFNLPDYYKLETHIFFDDAFLRMSENDTDPKVNQFVKDLVASVDQSASEVHETRITVRSPKKYITPYGGRLVWTLPGKTKMIAHLKDKKKIRAKKRWSQVMYMYFLLGHRLMEREDLSLERKDVISENTYVLALDGDIDFQPLAVHLLVDLMKKNKTLGAACGRIHPIGSGPMVWYQMFEYAVGHWLQKATEHMIGCVLCSPGCFSLFRGKALMDDNVMKKYTTRSSEAVHYVQYDQGEDRWLCTLLLQRGYRVEYSAASDAYTHCPEGFNEFYNQRRRWMPSTTANILDLLMDYKRTVAVNDNISVFYIAYQVVLMIGTVLGPGTIFLMLVGAFVAAFQMDQWSSFMWNVVPILVYMFVSFTFSDDKIQLFFAGLISAIYGLVMMAVLVGIMLQISADGFLAPSSLFFFCVAGEMIITGLLHPKELECLPYGIVYYVTVPSMYMLLVIYSVFNMNNVSWGTREVTVVKKPDENEDEKEAVKDNTTKRKVLKFLGSQNDDNAGSFEFSFGGIFKCFLCTRKDQSEEQIQLRLISNNLEKVHQKIEMIERLQLIDVKDPDAASKKMKIIEGVRGEDVTKKNSFEKAKSSKNVTVDEILMDEQSESLSWIDDEALLRGDVMFLAKKEETFWTGLLEKYLHPIDDSDEKARITQNLKDLRDKSVFAFFMLNALFVLVVFLLTLKKDLLHINWPLDIKYNITYLDDVDEIYIQKKYLELEPIGFVFLLFFAVLLVVQFVAMLFHRFGTFSQILANKHINFSLFEQSADNLSEEDIMQSNAVDIVNKFQRLKGAEDDDEEDNAYTHVSRRKTIHKIGKSSNKSQQPINDLQAVFKRRWKKALDNDRGPVKRDTIVKFEQRRKTINLRHSQANIGRPISYTIDNNTQEEDA